MNCEQILQETRSKSAVPLWQQCCRRCKSKSAVKLLIIFHQRKFINF